MLQRWEVGGRAHSSTRGGISLDVNYPIYDERDMSCHHGYASSPQSSPMVTPRSVEGMTFGPSIAEDGDVDACMGDIASTSLAQEGGFSADFASVLHQEPLQTVSVPRFKFSAAHVGKQAQYALNDSVHNLDTNGKHKTRNQFEAYTIIC